MRPAKFRNSDPGQPSEQRHTFGDDADLPFDLDGMRGQIESENFNTPGAGREQAGEHFDGRGFSGAVGAEEAEELSRRDAQIDAING